MRFIEDLRQIIGIIWELGSMLVCIRCRRRFFRGGMGDMVV